jgi:4-amino-4-deoxy-L-arabinose transferase-like glycosyltransferase
MSRYKLFLWLILLAALVIRVIFAFLTPAWQSPDEYPHYWVADEIARTGSLPYSRPVFPYYESFQPPLYYVAGSFLLRLFSDGAFFTEEYVKPMTGLLTLRLFSVMLAMLAIWTSYRILRKTPSLTKNDHLAGVAFLAFLPTFVGISSSVNNDALVILLCSISLYYSIRRRVDNKAAFLCGLWAGLALLAKVNAVLILPFLAFRVWQGADRRLSPALKRYSICLLAWAIGAIILALRNYSQYGDVMAINPGFESQFGFSVGLFGRALRNLTWSFWLAFGRFYQVNPGPVVYLLTALPIMLLSLIGWKRIYTDHQNWFHAIVGSLVIGVIVSLLYTLSYPEGNMTSWGKNLYPLLPLITVFFVLGLKSVSRKWPYAIPAITIAIMMAGCIWGLLKLSAML